jgi:guanine deaminase
LKAGLLGKKTIMGHCIHLSDDELKILKKTGTKIAHCPTSNIALNSGRMPIEKIVKYKIPFALATDIGAGPKLSMIDVMKSYLKIHKRFHKVTPIDALYRATLAGAEIMEINKEHGNLNKNKKAEFVMIKKSGLKIGNDKNKIIEAFVNSNVQIKTL